MTDSVLQLLKSIDPSLSLTYRKFYVSVAKDGQANNFLTFKPKKDGVRIEPKLEKSEELQNKLEEAGLDLMDYDSQSGRYRIRLTKGDVQKHEALIQELMRRAYDESKAGWLPGGDPLCGHREA